METSSLSSALPSIRIPTPCHENWDKMSPTEKGSFCKTCQKEVRDFTHSSLSEILDTLAESEEITCGRFNRSQLAPEHIIALTPIQSPRTWKKWMVAAFALFGLHTAEAQVTEMPADSFRSEISVEQGYLTGVVRGHKYQKPLEGATVALVNENGVLQGTYTDSTGSFRISLPEGIEASPMLSLRLRYMEGMYIISNPPLDGQHFEIELNEVIWLEEVVIAAEEPYGKTPLISTVLTGSVQIDGEYYDGLRYEPRSLMGYDNLNEFIFMRMGEGVSRRH